MQTKSRSAYGPELQPWEGPLLDASGCTTWQPAIYAPDSYPRFMPQVDMLKNLIPRIDSQAYQYVIKVSLLLPILGIFLITAALVSPQGEFPLNDDWIHAKAVQRLLEDGYYRGHPYVAATLVAQAYWGALFCKLFGFSFTTLRISTLVLAVIGGWAVALGARAMGLQHNLALLCGILYAINPLMLSLSYSFMTDVPFLALSALSGLYFLRFFRHNKLSLALLGNSFAVVGFFVRQFAITLPAAFVLTLAILWWRSKYQISRSLVAVIVGPWLIGISLYIWLSAIREGGTAVFLAPSSLFAVGLEAMRHYPIALCYMGLFALPLGAGVIWQLARKESAWNRQLVLYLSGVCGISLLVFILPMILAFVRQEDWLRQYPYRLPLLKNDYLHDLAIGLPHLHDRYPLPPIRLQEGWWLFTIAALLVAGLFCLSSFQLIRSIWSSQANSTPLQPEAQQRLFLLMWLIVALSIIYSPWRPTVFDRLLLAGLAPFILMLAYDMGRLRYQDGAIRIAAWGTVFIYAFSLLGLQNYFAWNHAVSTAQNTLLYTYQISPEVIRGADTFNGWYNSDKSMEVYNTKDFWKADGKGIGPWTFDNQFIITGADRLEGYQPFEQFPYFTWLGMKTQTITVFKRDQNSASNQ